MASLLDLGVSQRSLPSCRVSPVASASACSAKIHSFGVNKQFQKPPGLFLLFPFSSDLCMDSSLIQQRKPKTKPRPCGRGIVFGSPCRARTGSSLQTVSGDRLATLEISCAWRNTLVYFGRCGAHPLPLSATGSGNVFAS